MGGTNVVTNDSGVQTELSEYKPYGEFSRHDVTGQPPTKYYFTDQYLDEETALYYYGARYYSPGLGRFISADTVVQEPGNPQTLNRYAYALNNPVNRIDPTGNVSIPGVLQNLVKLAFDAVKSIIMLKQTAEEVGNNIAQAVMHPQETAVALKAGIKEQLSTEEGQDQLIASGIFFLGTKKFSEFIPRETKSSLSGSAHNSANYEKLKAQLTSQEIAGGHAFKKHIIQEGEFPGIKTKQQFADHIEGVITHSTEVRQLSNGRTAYWDGSTGTVVVRNPNALDGGTAFKPEKGYHYFKNILK